MGSVPKIIKSVAQGFCKKVVPTKVARIDLKFHGNMRFDDGERALEYQLDRARISQKSSSDQSSSDRSEISWEHALGPQ